MVFVKSVKMEQMSEAAVPDVDAGLIESYLLRDWLMIDRDRILHNQVYIYNELYTM